jgi:hypothetical protein
MNELYNKHFWEQKSWNNLFITTSFSIIQTFGLGQQFDNYLFQGKEPIEKACPTNVL